jgi:hypothetical protein
MIYKNRNKEFLTKKHYKMLKYLLKADLSKNILKYNAHEKDYIDLFQFEFDEDLSIDIACVSDNTHYYVRYTLYKGSDELEEIKSTKRFGRKIIYKDFNGNVFKCNFKLVKEYPDETI